MPPISTSNLSNICPNKWDNEPYIPTSSRLKHSLCCLIKVKPIRKESRRKSTYEVGRQGDFGHDNAFVLDFFWWVVLQHRIFWGLVRDGWLAMGFVVSCSWPHHKVSINANLHLSYQVWSLAKSPNCVSLSKVSPWMRNHSLFLHVWQLVERG